MKVTPNPRGPIRDWRKKFRQIEALRKKCSLEVACVKVGIAYSTYHEWKKRLANEKGT